MFINKAAFKSKTLWVSLIIALAPLFPAVREILVANPEAASMVVGGVVAFLRVITKQPIVLTEDK